MRFRLELDGQGLTNTKDQPSPSSLAVPPAGPHAAPASGTFSLRRKLRGGLEELSAELGANTRVMNTIGGKTGSMLVPFHATVNIGSSAARPSAFQYRLGIHQVRFKQKRFWPI